MEMKYTVTPVYDKIIKYKHSELLLLLGGAGSGKSYPISQYWVYHKLLHETGKTLVVSRRTMPSLKLSAKLEILSRLEEANLPYKPQKSENYLTYHGNKIIFMQLDDPAKLKSINANYWWLEEGTELNINTFTQVKLRNRKPNEDDKNQIIVSFNPVNKYNWVKVNLIDTNVPYVLLHSTWRNNPYLSKEYLRSISELKEYAPHLWEVYSEGKWGATEGVIYKRWKVGQYPEDTEGYKVYIGLDFGATNPTAIIMMAEKNEHLYVKEICYETNMSNQDIIRRLKEANVPRHLTIWADPAEPDRIKEIRRAGFNIRVAKKRVTDGIMAVQTYKIMIEPEAENVVKEISGYRWKEVNNITLDEPLKLNDHAMDAIRYGVYSEYNKTSPIIQFV